MTEEKYTSTSGDPYLEVHGTDIEGAMVASLRLWRYADGDLTEGRTYIIRGLKVAAGMMGLSDEGRHVPRADKVRAVECSSRIAAEDVSHVAVISEYSEG